MYKYYDSKSKQQQQQLEDSLGFFDKLRNDVNVSEFLICRDYFDLIKEKLNSLANDLCESLKESNEFQIAILWK